MKIKFANTEVDVWKLRHGVVVMDYCGKFWHISGIKCTREGVAILTLFDFQPGMVHYVSTELEWLEPHD